MTAAVSRRVTPLPSCNQSTVGIEAVGRIWQNAEALLKAIDMLVTLELAARVFNLSFGHFPDDAQMAFQILVFRRHLLFRHRCADGAGLRLLPAER